MIKRSGLVLAAWVLMAFPGIGLAGDCSSDRAAGGDESGRYAQSSCCEGHGGACGCRGARVICCDGTQSRSCACNADEAGDALALRGSAEQPTAPVPSAASASARE